MTLLRVLARPLPVGRKGIFADLATASPATPRTSNLWFSMTKIVTATAVMRLAEEGDLDLDG